MTTSRRINRVWELVWHGKPAAGQGGLTDPPPDVVRLGGVHGPPPAECPSTAGEGPGLPLGSRRGLRKVQVCGLSVNPLDSCCWYRGAARGPGSRQGLR